MNEVRMFTSCNYFILSVLICATFSSAVPRRYLNDIDDLSTLFLKNYNNPFRRSLENNGIERFPDESLNLKNDACIDFYGSTCNKTENANNNFEKRMKNALSKFNEEFMNELNEKLQKIEIINILSSIEKTLYYNCLLLEEESNASEENLLDEDSDYVENADENESSNEELEIENKSAESNSIESNDIDEANAGIKDAESENADPNKFKLEELFKKMVSTTGGNLYEVPWIEVDIQLAMLGFGYTFFEINVKRDPLQPDKNIIFLEPPSMKDWNTIKLADSMALLFDKLQSETYITCRKKYKSKFMKKVIFWDKSEEQNGDSPFLPDDEEIENDSNEDVSENKEEEEEEDIIPVCQDILEKSEMERSRNIFNSKNRDTLQFFNDVIKLVFDSVEVTNKQPLDKKYTIKEWNYIYNRAASDPVATLDWSQIIKIQFENVKISIDENDEIFVKNKPYFIGLADTLSNQQNKDLVHAVLAKFVTSNIRYHNWNFVESLTPPDKEAFCLNDTKLYGLSENIMENLKAIYLQNNANKAQRVLENIIKVFDRDILISQKLRDSEKAYLKSELNEITENVFGSEQASNSLSNYFADFQFTEKYFIDITNYRRILKNIELSKLKSNVPVSYEQIPFSINELDNPRNRFKLHALLSIVVNSANSEDMETYYATYGVKLAGFLLSLLKENRFANVLPVRPGVDLLIPHVAYPSETVKCFIPGNLVKYGSVAAYSTITEIYSTKIAFEAMANDLGVSSIKNFITAYTKAQCNSTPPKIIKKVLSNFEEELSAAFKCTNVENKHDKCSTNVF